VGINGGRELEPSDGELLRGIGDGDTEALRALYDRHAPWVLLRLSRRCSDPQLVEEVVQDTFVGVWKGARRYRGQGPVAAWVWGIAIRRLVDRLRGRARLPQLLLERGAEPSAEDLVLLGVEHGDLAGAINGLSHELRAVLQATVLDGLSMREAGQLLGIPTGTVKTRLMRARRELREALT